MQLAQISMAGAMLGAVSDVVPPDRFEEDTGPDPDGDPLRESLGRLLEGLDEYASVFDPLVPERPVHGRISDDVADVAIELAHGAARTTRPAAATRRCGGGSSPTCPTGARRR